MSSQDDATLELMLADSELRGFAVRMLHEALQQMRYDLKYGTPNAKALIYRTVTATILRQSLTKANDDGIDELRAQLDELRQEMRTGAPTQIDRQILRARPDTPHVARRPPALPPQQHAKKAHDRSSVGFSTKDL